MRADSRKKSFCPLFSLKLSQLKYATVNERLQNIEQKQSSLSSKYDNLLEATQGVNQKIQELQKSPKDLLRWSETIYMRVGYVFESRFSAEMI